MLTLRTAPLVLLVITTLSACSAGTYNQSPSDAAESPPSDTSSESSSADAPSSDVEPFTVRILSPIRIDEDQSAGTYTFAGENLTIIGESGPEIARMTVSLSAKDYATEEDIPGFTQGAQSWDYALSAAQGTLVSGYQTVTFRGYSTNDEMPFERVLEIDGQFVMPEVENPGGMLTVEWQTPEKLDTLSFLKGVGAYERVRPAVEKSFAESYAGGSDQKPSLPTDTQIAQHFVIHRVGTVTSAPYAGGTLLHMESVPFEEGPFSPSHYRAIEKLDHTLVLLKTASKSVEWETDKEIFRFTLDPRAELDLLPPETLPIPDSSYTLKRKSTSYEFFPTVKTRKAFESPEAKKTVFFDEDHGCLVVANNDGTYSSYVIELDVLPDTEEPTDILPYAAHESNLKLDITWNDGTKNDLYYTHGVFTCDRERPCYAIAKVENGKVYESFETWSEEGAVNVDGSKGYPLEVIGKTTRGDEVFREVYSDADLAEFTQEKTISRYLHEVYQRMWSEREKIAPHSFYEQHPVLYLKDPFGRYIRFTREDALSAAECGKPVIYLYPEQKQDVTVRVEPNGGFLKTEPAYGNGWRVHATPEGELTNSDGKTYPYLFWEGKAINYPAPKEGFVVARQDIASFLQEKLSILGLHEKEIADFQEFWVPRMQEKPYLFVSFVPQEQFDVLAPLTVSPKPDTVIRVFMDFRGLQNTPSNVTEPILTTPTRRGFTVVEWGGALRP